MSACARKTVRSVDEVCVGNADAEVPGEEPMRMKVRNGTPELQGDALCDTCRFAKAIRGRRLDEEIVFCGALSIEPVRVTFRVTSCTEFVDRREPPYHELLEKAWILRPATKRRAAGFVRADDLTADEARRLFTDPSCQE
jgi:hypothetical protein